LAVIRATLWDFGGVLSSSPFEAFAVYERDHGLPDGFIRGLNATNHHDNAWAHLERGDISFDEFRRRFEAEARDAGGVLDAAAVMGLLGGSVRPAMVEAVRRCHEQLKTALLTNNFVAEDPAGAGAGGGSDHAAIFELFDVIIESSKAGVRTPDPRFYRMACDELGIEPSEAVFLDDLGVNLKPAREMGMTTIKVVDPSAALAELEAVLGFSLG
jgi:putative hydrolase of the HAD superfamily